MPSTPAIRTAIQRALDQNGWKARQLAQALDIAPSTVYRWLNGQSDPDIQLWPEIERALNLPEATILKAKHSSMADEYQGSKERLFETINYAGQRLKAKREQFNTFDDFYAYHVASEYSVQALAETLSESPETINRWASDGVAPPERHWAAIEAHFHLPEGTMARTATLDPVHRVKINPDEIAAHGDLKDEDRPAMARLLEQILENQAELKQQQAKIIEHLNLGEDEP